MDESLKWDLLAKYLADECDSQERDEIENWIFSDPENQQLLEILKISWNTTEPTLQTSGTDRLWQQLAVSVELDPGTAEEVNLTTKNKYFEPKLWSFFSHWPPSPVWRYAAVMLIFLISALYIFSDDLSSLLNFTGPSDLITISVENGQREHLTLSDGSVVTLDSGTKFTYPQKFSGDSREVFLSGEAFFEVAPIAGKPFTVYANQAAIEVVGTKFNIRAWQQELKLTVTVSEGKVLLHPDKKKNETPVSLEQGYASTLPLNGPPTAPRLVDVAVSTGWMNNEIYFEDTALSEILAQLERWYDITFVYPNSTTLRDRLTIFLSNKTLDDHLKLIGELADVRFVKSGKSYQIVPK